MRRVTCTLIIALACVASVRAFAAQRDAPPPIAPVRLPPLTAPGSSNLGTAPDRFSQSVQDPRVDALASRVDRLERDLNRGASGAVLFLFGAFCALWAQNTRRSPWAWFFLGAIFNVITLLVLLSKNAEDLRRAGAEPAGRSFGVAFAIVLGVAILATFVLLYWSSAR